VDLHRGPGLPGDGPQQREAVAAQLQEPEVAQGVAGVQPLAGVGRGDRVTRGLLTGEQDGLELDRAVVGDRDNAIGLGIDAVLDPVLPGAEENRCGRGVVGRNEVTLRGRATMSQDSSVLLPTVTSKRASASAQTSASSATGVPMVCRHS
jgi:hypothetical protein